MEQRGGYPLDGKNCKIVFEGFPFMQLSHLLNLCRYFKAFDQDFVADVW